MILVVAGTRPELLKLAPCVAEAKRLGLPVHVHCTMQSPDLVDRAILEWDSKTGDTNPFGREIDLRDMAWESTGDVAGLGISPSIVVVQGDTRTAYRAAVCAYEHSMPIFHLEAGVRTYDLSSPWPEEGYRQMISRIARWHACTTFRNHNNLTIWDAAMNGEARVTGSPIVESVRERAKEPSSPTPSIVLTLHRRENRGHFREIVQGVLDVVGDPGRIGWYAHPNSWAHSEAGDLVTAQPPLDSVSFAGTIARTKLVITDSGGVQEETNCLGVPCVVARTVTDRPESLGAGGAILGGNTRESVADAIARALLIDRTTIDTTVYGDGTASTQIAAWWQDILNG
jgi:UDP-N-acetylglucosamine 2-epimerase (non-hydrolysing)